MTILLVILFFFFHPEQLPVNYKTIASVSYQGQKNILTDKLGNFYVLSGTTITKYSPYGKKIVSYSNGGRFN